ncbi:MAG: ATPase/protein kinase [Acidobacteria bacterium RBG_16_64_8]|nr:MAG: ATPase/protein kinase [Acidobacteria bacterium RBG_16_64_8]
MTSAARQDHAHASALTIAEGVRHGHRQALARAITLVESTRSDHRARATEILELLMNATGNSTRLGISGAPGVGKSRFIDALGRSLIDREHRVGVLAVDPSSSLSGGSILGDKTRMEELARRREAFIRPSPAGRTLGGVARRTREAMLLCEAAGFDVIIVETVGVGQSETMVADMTDVFLLLLQPGGGDELQGIKRGIVELADIVVVNKADGELEAEARRTAAQYASALSLLRPRTQTWSVPVETCSAITGKGVAEVWAQVERYMTVTRDSGQLSKRRIEQARAWLWNETCQELETALRSDPRVRGELPALESAVAEGTLPPTSAAGKLLDIFLGDRRKEA